MNLMRGVVKICEQLSRNSEATANGNFEQWFKSFVLENQEVPVVKSIYDKIVSANQSFA